MMPGVNQEMMAAVQEITKLMRCEVIVDYKTNTLAFRINSDDAEAQERIPVMMRLLSDALSTQFSAIFNTKVEVTEGDIK